MDNFSVLHGMAGNYGAGGFVNITVTVQFTKPLDCLLVASMVSRVFLPVAPFTTNGHFSVPQELYQSNSWNGQEP